MNRTISDLGEIRAFAAVAARRSFVGAARALAMPKATVSRKVQALEGRMGVRLLQRTTRRVSLTEAGAVLLERCRRIEEEIVDAEVAVERLRGAPRGTLRVAAPYTLAAVVLTPVLPAFLARYPEVRVVLTLRNETEDLVARGTDVAISPWPLADSIHAARYLGSAATGLFASREYLRSRGLPRSPGELEGHAGLLYAGGGRPTRPAWTLRRGPRAAEVPFEPALTCNDGTPLLAAMRRGCGILQAAELSVAADLRRRAVVRVLPEWEPDRFEIRAVFAGRAGLPPKVRVFLDFVAERVAALLAAGA